MYRPKVGCYVMFSQWSDREIEQAAECAIQIMAPGGGFIGFPVDAIFNSQPWDKVELLLRCWRELDVGFGQGGV